jgi:hypothetical protein
VPQAVTMRTEARTLGARLAKRVGAETGDWLVALEQTARRGLRPILGRLPLASRREVETLALRVTRLERRLGSAPPPAAARRLMSILAHTGGDVVVPLVDELRIEQALRQHLTSDEQQAVRVRFGLGDELGEARGPATAERRGARRALTKLWLSSRQTDG